MTDEQDTYVCREPAYTEERDTACLLIWPDIPNWIVVDREAFEFIKAIQGEHTLEYVRKQFFEIAEGPLTSKEADAFIESLLDTHVLYNKEDGPFDIPARSQKIRSIILYPTNRCNLRCIMCYNNENLQAVGEKTDELTAEEYKDFFDQIVPFLADSGTSVQILGGEPLVVPEKTLKIMEYASSLVDHIALSTNGTLITREFAKRAARIEHVNVQVSIDSPYREHHETLRGKGTYDRTIEGIKLLCEENVATALNMVCHQGNLDELEEYYKLAHGLGVKRARFIPLQLAGAAIECGLKVPSYKELMGKSLAVFKKNPQYKTLTGSDFLSTTAAICRNCAKQGWCGTGLRVMMLNADGTVYPCPNHYLPEFVVGNIREKRFAEMWESSEVLRKIRETYPVESLNEQCAQCAVRHWCVGWCRGETYQVTGSMTAPSVLCEDIKQMIIDMFFNVSLERDVFGEVHKEFGKAQDLKRL